MVQGLAVTSGPLRVPPAFPNARAAAGDADHHTTPWYPSFQQPVVNVFAALRLMGARPGQPRGGGPPDRAVKAAKIRRDPAPHETQGTPGMVVARRPLKASRRRFSMWGSGQAQAQPLRLTSGIAHRIGLPSCAMASQDHTRRSDNPAVDQTEGRVLPARLPESIRLIC
jgi:hypothetical protein